ncbi:MAG TPA: Mov34/MPN/PAD-1 family protein [Polyangiaceae bacterium]|nr:Mov34/MPN/PAD-1 family protein [Polyangiaceae bacterium]
MRKFRGEPSQRHEGLVFWAGRVVGRDSYVLAAIVPDCEHAPYRVFASEAAMGAVARVARQAHLGVVAQVHSHPGSDTRHSDGDDEMIFMPFEGMFSLVVAGYGDGSLLPEEGAGLHQFQDGLWVKVSADERPLIAVPTLMEGASG